MDSLYHIRICSDETPQSHRQNTRNTTLFIAPLADVMHCQVLGGQRGGGGGAAAAAATLYKGATKEPGPRRWRRRTRWRQNSPARRRTWRRPPPSTFAYGLYPKQQLDAGHRLRRMCAAVLHQIPNFSYILISWNHVVSRSMMVSRKLEFPK